MINPRLLPMHGVYMTQEGKILQARKRIWIPLCCAGRYTEKQAAERIGIDERSVSRLKKRYRLIGDAAFINGHTGKSLNRKFTPAVCTVIVSHYRKNWDGANFALFRDMLKTELGIDIAPITLKNILNSAGIHSPKERGPRKTIIHNPRAERKRAGELIQLDGSEFDWFMTGERCTMHGGIDDATHSIVGLYLCRNECRFGYSEVLRQQLERHGAARAIYIDRHASLVKNARKKSRTLEERLEYSRNESTHWTDICARLDTDIILALSPQAKGRIERLWQTLQGRLPFIFRRYGINTIEKANEFLSSYIDIHNARFSVPAKDASAAWKRPKITQAEIDFLLQVRVEKTTHADGTFVFHSFTFRLDAPRRTCKKFVLCMSERDGVRAYVDGAYYPVSLMDPLTDCVDDAMPQVEKELVAKYCLRDQHVLSYA